MLLRRIHSCIFFIFYPWSWNNIINVHILFISKETLKAFWEIIFHALGLKQVLFINRACVNHRQSWKISWISHGENIRFHALEQINRKIILESCLSKFYIFLKNKKKKTKTVTVPEFIHLFTLVVCQISKVNPSCQPSVKLLKSIFRCIELDTLESEHQEL